MLFGQDLTKFVNHSKNKEINYGKENINCEY